MENSELLKVIYNQLKLHSSNWTENIDCMNFLIQEIHKSTKESRPDVISMIRILQEKKIIELISRTPLIYKVNEFDLTSVTESIRKGSISTYQTNDMFELLDIIEKRPTLFLNKARLDFLQTFLLGYKLASENHSLNFTNTDLLDKFSIFLAKKFVPNNSNPPTWYGILSSEFDTGNNGLNKFYENLWEFRLKTTANKV